MEKYIPRRLKQKKPMISAPAPANRAPAARLIGKADLEAGDDCSSPVGTRKDQPSPVRAQTIECRVAKRKQPAVRVDNVKGERKQPPDQYLGSQGIVRRN